MASACMHTCTPARCSFAPQLVKRNFAAATRESRCPLGPLQGSIALRQGVTAAAEKRETVFGDLIDEEEQIQNIPPPGEQDFWEGEKWEWLGKLSFVLVPALVLLAVLVGAFAAKTYDSGATTYLAPPSPDDATVKLIPGKFE